MKNKLKMLKEFKNKKGFTLIELIVVIAVLGILVLLAAPKFLGYTEDARIAHIKNDVEAYERAITSNLAENPNYIQENDQFDTYTTISHADELSWNFRPFEGKDNMRVYTEEGEVLLTEYRMDDLETQKKFMEEYGYTEEDLANESLWDQLNMELEEYLAKKNSGIGIDDTYYLIYNDNDLVKSKLDGLFLTNDEGEVIYVEGKTRDYM